MVKSVSSLTGNGLRDWLIQRLTAVIIGVYSIYLVAFIVCHPGLTFTQWSTLFASPYMRIASTVTLLALLAHAWIGVWTIATDYLKIIALRIVFYIAVLLILLVSLIWGITIFWGL